MLRPIFLRTKKRAWTPSDLTTSLWLDASDTSTITQSAGAVSVWADKSGNSYNAVQGTGSKQPSTGTRTLNGLNVLDFDGVDDHIYSTFGQTFTQPNTYLAVTIKDNLAAGWELDGINNTGRNAFNTRSVGYQMFAGTASLTGGIADTNPHVISATFNGASSEVFTDGTSISTGDCGAHSITGLNIGSAPLGSQPSKCAIAEVVFFNSTISTDNRQKIEGYLAWKWGTVANLPVNHPYKLVRP